MEKALPAIPAKRYFTIGEGESDFVRREAVRAALLEQEFTQLKPVQAGAANRR